MSSQTVKQALQNYTQFADSSEAMNAEYAKNKADEGKESAKQQILELTAMPRDLLSYHLGKAGYKYIKSKVKKGNKNDDDEADDGEAEDFVNSPSSWMQNRISDYMRGDREAREAATEAEEVETENIPSNRVHEDETDPEDLGAGEPKEQEELGETSEGIEMSDLGSDAAADTSDALGEAIGDGVEMLAESFL